MSEADVIQYDDDLANPHSGLVWRDLEGPIGASTTGANRPTLTQYTGDIYEWAFAAGDIYRPIKFHMPHDWARGTDMFLHLHWSHNGSAISGQLDVDWHITYSKGHNQANFPVQLTHSQTILAPDIAAVPALRHRIDEFRITTPGGDTDMLDTDELEVDGLILMTLEVTAIPTITGGAAKPFLHYTDLHYQADRVGTRRRAPNFYSN